jgi:hypothetical protein
MRREGAHRLAVVAGSVLACAVASLPYAGSGGDRLDEVATVDGSPSRAVAATPTPTTASPVVLASSPAPAPPVEARPAPPVEAPLPPPPPPPPGADPTAGVVLGDGPSASGVAVPTAAPPSPSRSTVADGPPGERVWAVVIGVDDYPGTRSDLRAAAADAGDLVTALLRFGVPTDHVLPLYDGSATVGGVLGAVDWLVAHAGPEDTAVLLFAGHVRDLGGGTEALVTADAGWIADWYLADRLRALRARDAWFVVAGCYGGGFDELLGPGRVLTAGAGPGELAYENDAYGRSYLAEFVLRRGLVEGAAGAPTVQAAVDYGMRELGRQHPERQVWHVDAAGHVISLDGIRRDGTAQPGAPSPPPPPEPDGATLVAGTLCLLGLCDD